MTGFVATHGVYAVFLLMAIDAVFPAASELVMLVGGALATAAFARHATVFGVTLSKGFSTFVAVALAGTIGYLIGSIAGWALGRYGGRPLVERHGRWFHLSPAALERAEAWFARWGAAGVLIGRLVPLVRSFVSIPAGVFKMPFVTVRGPDVDRLCDLGFRASRRRLGGRDELLDVPSRLALRRDCRPARLRGHAYGGSRTPPRVVRSSSGRCCSTHAVQATTASGARHLTGRQMLNKVPEVTVYFWIIKVLCTTVGETASDYLSDNVGLGLTNTTFITAAVLLAVLVFQFRARRYIAPIYWAGIVLISVVGTQITDNLTDNAGVSLVTTTIVFSIALAIVFAAWWASERTLSIHTIFTTRREAFYWLAVLFTFALGTAAGDLTAERLNVGYAWSVAIFAGAIAVVAFSHYVLKLNAVAAFWIAYILTRPLGASIGDELSQTRKDGGLGLGTTVTSVIFLSAILIVVTYLTITKRDIGGRSSAAEAHAEVLVVADRTAVTPQLADALRARVERGPATFHVLVANPAPTAEVTAHERQEHLEEAKRILSLTLPSSSRRWAPPSRAPSRHTTTRWMRLRMRSTTVSSTRSSSRRSRTT